MPKGERNTKKTTDEFVNEMKTVNPNIIILGEYVNACTKIECECVQFGHHWFSDPKHLLRKQGCPICGKKRCHESKRKTQEEYEREVAQQNPNIEIIGKYTLFKAKIKGRCKVCGTVREVVASCFSREKYGCPVCFHNMMADKYRKPKEVFIDEMAIINPDMDIVGDYVNDSTKIDYICKRCGKTHSATPNNLLGGSGCPTCFASKGEKRIERWLENNNIDYLPQKTFDDCQYKSELRFDFYIPKNNVLIEYDGEQHFHPVDWGFHDKCRMEKNFKEIQERDAIKNKYCKDNNIKLLRIPYTEFDNIEKILLEKLS